jgi:hypothetical protein
MDICIAFTAVLSSWISLRGMLALDEIHLFDLGTRFGVGRSQRKDTDVPERSPAGG